jgi:polyisoprenoid-binding protein YceI
LSTAGTQPATTVRYLVDAKKSRFTVRALASGLLSALGHSPTISIPDFEGEFVLNREAMDQSSVHLVIDAASLTVMDDIRDKDRAEIERTMQQEVLETDSFPEIVYQASRCSASKTAEGQYAVTLNGQLTLHGVAQDQPVSARVYLTGDTLRAVGDFTLSQKEYEIRPVSAVGGTIKLKDELKLTFDMNARKQA